MPVNNKYYMKIHGWFNFEDVYERIVQQIPQGATFIEIGSWQGRSMCYFCTYAKEQGRDDIKVFAVDPWTGTADDTEQQPRVQSLGGPDGLHQTFLNHIKVCGFDEWVTDIRLPSVEAAPQFEDSSLFCVYVDGDHSQAAVEADINTWLPKVQSGGILAGHDYHPDSPGIVNAVHDIIGQDNITVFAEQRTWWYNVP